MLLKTKKTNAQRTDSDAQNALTKANHFVVVAILREEIAHNATRAHTLRHSAIHSAKCECDSLCASVPPSIHTNVPKTENGLNGSFCICVCRLGVRIYIVIYICIGLQRVSYGMEICNGNCGKRLLGFACDNNNNLIQHSIPVGYPLWPSAQFKLK